ncbi:YafY family transcriptional regulator [Nonomuraea sp. PA05]|uniref:helix-turn-helix transcriptional regulator n=1 Tax=Nonomuraea sp. PA05 TaxID=2604466 RepID=UPI0011D5B0C4|nr:YafY family protein [Nonomuraea sp. PA05]TYB66747.1 YafY family transcriptional regulator [Nonomuraea sp. PA05]
MSRPTGRVLTLLELLQSGGTRTMAELADRLGVDGRTVRRYVGHLIDLGVPVESVRGRYGGYHLARGYRLPPLMLDDDEALAVLLGLVAGRRAGDTASETAAAKIRRVLPDRLARRLDALLESLAFTGPSTGSSTGPFTGPLGARAAPDAEVLLTLADAVRHRRPVSFRYADRHGRGSDRTLHPYGIVGHSGRWYVHGEDARAGESRTFRLDRIADARALPGSFAVPAGADPVERVLTGFATASYRHEVVLRIRATVEQLRARLPAGVAQIEAVPGPEGEGWLRVLLRVERLDWLPGVLASLDRPFVIERPDELRDLVLALAGRLASHAQADTDA